MEKEYILKVLYKSAGTEILSVGEKADIILYNLKFLKINHEITGWRYNGEGYFEKHLSAKSVYTSLMDEEIKSARESLKQEGFILKVFGNLEEIVS